MQDNSIEKLKGQVLVPTEALRTQEEFEICIYLQTTKNSLDAICDMV